MFTILEVKAEKFLKHKDTQAHFISQQSDDLISCNTAPEKTLSYTCRRMRVEKASDIIIYIIKT